ncbi:hypothetical protein B1748_28435 [Paenibacillus sp. MY03]|jgi:hypothetical protein|uniref:Uncharacterized protein n=1 Tax=Paenibacillus agaridevorans TaxID=171404 RepID=A0A2R5F147_9BACL|nr:MULTISPECIES: hypothetical protein [Paenibacillus]OUS70423.1 hypothetical protein B1748_28435 [Paenibacillus sp. MY03]GBG11158.1 hypothetical protein PAT3040_05946 [Paenibacillus agaridevorans]
MKYNFIRPILLIATALLVKSLVTNLCMVFGMQPESAESIGFIAMIIAALIVYTRIAKKRRQ